MLKLGAGLAIIGFGLIIAGDGMAPPISMPVGGGRHLTIFPPGLGLFVGVAGGVLMLAAAVRRTMNRRTTGRRDSPS